MAKILCICLMLVAGTLAVLDIKNVHLTWGVTDGFYKVPLTLEKFLANDNKYVKMTTDEELKVDFYSYPNDPSIAVGFDTYGNIAAVRYSLVKDNLDNRAVEKGVAYNYTLADKPLYKTGVFWNKEVYYSTALFASPEELAAGGRKDTKGLAAENVYLPLGGKYTLLPKYECDAPKLGFTKGGCFNFMGIHYILDMSKKMACEAHEGPFLIYDQGDLVALGWFPFGTFTTVERRWFEDAPSYLTKVFAPDGPDCFEPTAANFGVISFHIFFKEHPRTTICELGANKSVC